ncbi:MAG: pentapeptide repeat-containing protein [Candidatus Omnitrophota bacterium]
MGKCNFTGCKNEALYSSELCWHHVSDEEEYKKTIETLLTKQTSFKSANLTKVNLSGLDFTNIDLEGANLARADLREAKLFNSNLENAELLGANLAGADLTGANLQKSDLTRSSLRSARLWHANLSGANLVEADLAFSDLWNANLSGVRLWRTNLTDAVSITKKSFLLKNNKYSTGCRIDEKGILSSEESYRDLKKYFIANGRYDDASWASFREKTMERLLLKKKRNIAYLPSLIMDLLCGYGEKPHRIILSSLFVILFYAAMYYLLSAVTYASCRTYEMIPGDYIYYSIITFTTVGYGDFIPKAVPLFRFTAASEAFIGAFMIGLFILTLARKYSAR